MIPLGVSLKCRSGTHSRPLVAFRAGAKHSGEEFDSDDVLRSIRGCDKRV